MPVRMILIAGVAAVALVGGGSAAVAETAASSGPINPGGVIHGCWTTAAVHNGHVLVLQNANAKCPPDATPISWNQTGPAGSKGATGAKGHAGEKGATGATGPAGSTGATGPAGAQGPAGPSGTTGAQGPAGPAGPAGTTGVFGTNNNQSIAASGSGAQCTIGDVVLTASTEIADNWLPAKGQTLAIQSDTALFSLIGVNYGGNGTSNFELPNLTAAAPNGLTYIICVTGVFP